MAGGEAVSMPAQWEAPVQLDAGGGDDLSAGWDWEEVEKRWEGYPELVSGTTVELVACYYVRYAPFSLVW
jgi:hypothetical protein